MISKINDILAEVPKLIAENEEQLEALRLKYLSKKGLVNQLMADFRNVAAEQKREVGMRVNELKDALQTRFNELKAQLATAWASPSPMVLRWKTTGTCLAR